MKSACVLIWICAILGGLPSASAAECAGNERSKRERLESTTADSAETVRDHVHLPHGPRDWCLQPDTEHADCCHCRWRWREAIALRDIYFPLTWWIYCCVTTVNCVIVTWHFSESRVILQWRLRDTSVTVMCYFRDGYVAHPWQLGDGIMTDEG